MILIIIYLLVLFKNTIIIRNNFTTTKSIFGDEIFRHQKSYFSLPMTFDNKICFLMTFDNEIFFFGNEIDFVATISSPKVLVMKNFVAKRSDFFFFFLTFGDETTLLPNVFLKKIHYLETKLFCHQMYYFIPKGQTIFKKNFWQ